MDFWDATKVLFRRWYLALPLLLITLGVTAYTATPEECAQHGLSPGEKVFVAAKTG